MNKKIKLFKKAKNTFLIDIESNKYYDLTSNSNILGHSHKKLTTIVKNSISSSWNIKENSIYHKRLINYYKKNISDKYDLFFYNSLAEFIQYLQKYNSQIKYTGNNFKRWVLDKQLDTYDNIIDKNKKRILIIDMASLYIKMNGNKANFDNYVKNLNKSSILVYNYLWYPDKDIEPGNADIVIMPEFYSGNFNFINVLIKKDFKKKLFFQKTSSNIQSAGCISALKLLGLLSSIKINPNLLNDTINFKCFDRLLVTTDKKNKDLIKSLRINHKILLNEKPPYYNYLPLCILENETDYLKKYLI